MCAGSKTEGELEPGQEITAARTSLSGDPWRVFEEEEWDVASRLFGQNWNFF